MVRWLVALALLLASGISTFARAAEIEIIDGGDLDIVLIRGPIERGDSARFVSLVENKSRVSVILESPGGVVRDALSIGAEIRLRNFSTMVAPQGECFSACGLIWVSGARRYMSPDSLIGFHAAYRTEQGEFIEDGMGNAEIGSFLTHLGLRIEAIRYFTIAGPRDFRLLTPQYARALGIDVFVNDGSNIVAPANAPTVDVLADRFVSYSFLMAQCGSLLGLDDDHLRQQAEASANEGQELVGPDGWVDLWLPLLDEVKMQISSRGSVALCIETEEQLRNSEQTTSVVSPSFDCRKASTPTERAICAAPSLWVRDRAMNSIYLFVRSSAHNSRTQILETQRAWMRERDACQDDSDCLLWTYDQRLSLFEGLDTSSM